MNKIIILLLAIVLFGQSCANHLNHKVNINSYKSKPKAIIAIEMVYLEKGIFWDSNIPVEFTLAKVEPEYFSDKRKTYRIKKPGTIMIDPGTYVIDNIRLESGSSIWMSTSNGLLSNGEVVFGAFSVQSGKLYDTGQIWVETLGGIFNITQKKSDDNKIKAHLNKLDQSLSKQPVEYLDIIPSRQILEKVMPET